MARGHHLCKNQIALLPVDVFECFAKCATETSKRMGVQQAEQRRVAVRESGRLRSPVFWKNGKALVRREQRSIECPCGKNSDIDVSSGSCICESFVVEKMMPCGRRKTVVRQEQLPPGLNGKIHC
jgi:hypothetical protein